MGQEVCVVQCPIQFDISLNGKIQILEKRIGIKNLTVKRPQNVSWRDTGNLTLIIPDPRYGKDPETYNYLWHDSILIIEEEIETLLRAELYSTMQRNKFRHGIMYKKSLLQFMDKYHIEDKHEDALMKAFQRWKKKTEEEREKRN